MAMTRAADRRRRAGATAALAAAGVLAWPAPAYAADVTTDPTTARQGGSVKLEFVVPEERPGGRADRIEIRLPADAPVAEVYPMSVPGWAPRVTTRALDRPVAGLHSAHVDLVTSAVTWTRMPGAGAGPARLTLSMGPLPPADRLAFEVVQTYADGTVVRRTPTLTLLPPEPGAVVGHGAAPDTASGPGGHGAAPGDTASGPGGHGATTGHGGHGTAPGTATRPRAAGGGDRAPGDGPATTAGGGGNGDGMLAAGLLAGLGGGAALGWLVSRWRRRTPAEPVDPDLPA